LFVKLIEPPPFRRYATPCSQTVTQIKKIGSSLTSLGDPGDPNPHNQLSHWAIPRKSTPTPYFTDTKGSFVQFHAQADSRSKCTRLHNHAQSCPIIWNYEANPFTRAPGSLCRRVAVSLIPSSRAFTPGHSSSITLK
jgi:hypothetical protein